MFGQRYRDNRASPTGLAGLQYQIVSPMLNVDTISHSWQME